MPTTVQDVMDRLGPALVRAAAGPLDMTVAELVVTDRAYPAVVASQVLLVAPGYHIDEPAFADLCVTAAEAGVSAVALKGHAAPEDEGAGGLTILLIDPAADWAHVIALMRTAISVPDDVHPEDSLFGLADALASLCGGPVVLHDPAWQLLAYSTGQHMDPVRNETILGRRAPAQAIEQLRQLGIVDRLIKGEIVDIAEGTVEGLSRRMAVAARAGSELLATVWLQPEADADEAEIGPRLRRAADVAALTLLRHAAAGHAGTGAADAAFSALLGGARTERLVAEQLRVQVDAGFVLAGLRPTSSDERDRAATVRRLVSLARSYCDAYRVSAQVAATTDAVYLVFSCADEPSRQRAVRIVTDIHTKLQASAPHRAMLSSLFHSLAETSSVRRDVDDLLDLAERRGWSGLTDSDHVQASWRLEQFREIALAHPGLLSGPVMRLAEHDRLNGTEYVDTLRAYFGSVGDAKLAADKLGLHVNTVRYRVNKACDIAGLDLNNPDERLVAELQVRLLT